MQESRELLFRAFGDDAGIIAVNKSDDPIFSVIDPGPRLFFRDFARGDVFIAEGLHRVDEFCVFRYDESTRLLGILKRRHDAVDVRKPEDEQDG